MRKIFFVLLFVFFLANQTFAGWYLISITQSATGETETKTWIQGNVIRQSTQDLDFIYNGNTEEITIISHKIGMYWTGKMEELEADLPKAISIAVEQFSNTMPANLREQFRKTLLSNLQNSQTTAIKVPMLKFEKTKETEEIAGFKSTKYKVSSDDNLVEYLWFTDELNLSADFKSEQFEYLLSKFSFTNQVLYNQTAEYFDFAKNGFATKIEVINNADLNNPLSTKILRFALKEELPIETFWIPKTYKTIDILGLIQFVVLDKLQNSNK